MTFCKNVTICYILNILFITWVLTPVSYTRLSQIPWNSANFKQKIISFTYTIVYVIIQYIHIFHIKKNSWLLLMCQYKKNMIKILKTNFSSLLFSLSVWKWINTRTFGCYLWVTTSGLLQKVLRPPPNWACSVRPHSVWRCAQTESSSLNPGAEWQINYNMYFNVTTIDTGW